MRCCHQTLAGLLENRFQVVVEVDCSLQAKRRAILNYQRHVHQQHAQMTTPSNSRGRIEGAEPPLGLATLALPCCRCPQVAQPGEFQAHRALIPRTPESPTIAQSKTAWSSRAHQQPKHRQGKSNNSHSSRQAAQHNLHDALVVRTGQGQVVADAWGVSCDEVLHGAVAGPVSRDECLQCDQLT